MNKIVYCIFVCVCFYYLEVKEILRKRGMVRLIMG